MALHGSGILWASQIRDNFGGGNPWYISDYYRGGPRVPNVAQNNNIPTSGYNTFWNYYNSTAATISATANPAQQVIFQAEPAPGSRGMAAGTTISGAGLSSGTWTRLSGSANISSTTALSVTFTQTCSKNNEFYSVWRFTGDNGLSIDITVYFYYYTDL